MNNGTMANGNAKKHVWGEAMVNVMVEKIKNNSDILVGCLVKLPEVWIVGYLPITEVDEIKILHHAGTKIAPNFILPPPDSFAIPMNKLLPLLSLFQMKEGANE